MAGVFFAMRFWPWSGRGMARSLEDVVEEDQAELLGPNPAGLPEADLTEEQRQEAIRRMKNKPRIG